MSEQQNPGAGLISQFLHGKLFGEESARVEEYLLTNPTALSAYVDTSTEDEELIDSLRSRTALKYPDLEDLASLISRLNRLNEAKPATPILSGVDDHDFGAMNMSATNIEALAPTSSRPKPLDDPTIVLAPAQLKGELGRLSHYRVMSVLGIGGMGAVFEAIDPRLDRRIALKVMKPEVAAHPDSRERFLREARATAKVEHPNIITIHQVDEDRGVPFLAMPLLRGESLQDRLKQESPLSVPLAVEIARQVAVGLAAAHREGLMHRDIKPANIWLEPGDSPEQPHIRILDFGLARPTGTNASLTQSGVVLGTPAYMAPEQGRGHEVDNRADLFSLGITFYEMLTGDRPFRGGDVMSILTSLAVDTPKMPTTINSAIPPHVASIVMSLLEKDPANRPQLAGEVAQQLQRRLIPVIEVLPPQPESRPVYTPSKSNVWDSIDDTADINIGSSNSPKPLPIKPAKRMLIQIGLASLALILAAFVTVVIIRDKNGKEVSRHEIPEGGSFEVTGESKNDPSKSGSNSEDAWVKKVQAMKPADQIKAVSSELKRLNPKFEGNITYTQGENGVTAMRFNVDAVTNLAPLRAMTRLTDLVFIRTREADLGDLTPLKGLPLTRLICEGNQVSDLSPLKGMRLNVLFLSFTKVKDLSPLSGMPLVDLRLARTPVVDLTPLKGIKLEALHAHTTGIADLSPLSESALKFIDVGATKVSDLSPLKNLPLKELGVTIDVVRDAPVIREMPLLSHVNNKPILEFWKEIEPELAAADIRLKTAREELKNLIVEMKKRNPEFDGNIKASYGTDSIVGLSLTADRVIDISPLKAIKSLRHLSMQSITESEFSDLSPLTGIPLISLECERNRVADLTPLKGMPLEKLWISYCRIKSLAPLKDMPLKDLRIGATLVADLSPLKGINLLQLHAHNTPITDLSPLRESRLKYLDVRNTKISDYSPMADWPLMEFNGILSETDFEFFKRFKLLVFVNGKPASDYWLGADPAFAKWLKSVAPLKGQVLMNSVDAELKRLNPDYHGECEFEIKADEVDVLSLKNARITDIRPLQALTKLRQLSLRNTQVSDLSPLAKLPIIRLDLSSAKVIDLSPIRNLPVEVLHIDKVDDLSILKSFKLKHLHAMIDPKGDADLIKSIKTLETINEIPVADFLKGEGKK